MFVTQPFRYVCYALNICDAMSHALFLSISDCRDHNPKNTHFLLFCFPRKEPINILHISATLQQSHLLVLEVQGLTMASKLERQNGSLPLRWKLGGRGGLWRYHPRWIQRTSLIEGEGEGGGVIWVLLFLAFDNLISTLGSRPVLFGECL